MRDSSSCNKKYVLNRKKISSLLKYPGTLDISNFFKKHENSLVSKAISKQEKIEKNWISSVSSSQYDFSLDKIDIVIPVYNALEDLKKCLLSVQQNTGGFKVHTIIVNDGSNTETTEWLRKFCKNNKMFNLIEHGMNKGYTKAVNTGLKASTSNYVITLNSDTIVTIGWLSGLIRCVESDKKIGITGPLSNAASWQNVPSLYGDSGSFAVNKLPDDISPDDMAFIVGHASNRIYPRLPFVNGFCFLIKREVLDAIGYMDEVNFPLGYGEENDFCIRASDAGFILAIADDVYVYHSKSKSFGHESRKILSQKGADNLRKKHSNDKVNKLIELIKNTEQLDFIRSKVKKNILDNDSKINFLADITTIKILFLLPVQGGGGGAHSVIQEVMAMRRIGIKANVAVKFADVEKFIKNYPEIVDKNKFFIGFDSTNLVEISEEYDIVIATVFHSILLLKSILEVHSHILPAYYIQDYEPLFFETDSENWKLSYDSYTAIPGIVPFAKTDWICRKVEKHHNIKVHKVSPSIDHDVYKSKNKAFRLDIHLCAMIRPQTPRRGASRTMDLFYKLSKEFPNLVKFHIFGCDNNSIHFKNLNTNFKFKNYGELTRKGVAEILANSDVFIDLSDYQAFGRTALEAMACGATSVVPVQGGTGEYAVNMFNSLVVDSFNEKEYFNSGYISQKIYFRIIGMFFT